MNMVVITGRLGADAKLTEIKEDMAVSNFSLAESRSWTTDGGEKQSRTIWHRIQAWNYLAKVCDGNLKKGMKVTIYGELDYSEYKNKEGESIKEAIIKASNVEYSS